MQPHSWLLDLSLEVRWMIYDALLEAEIPNRMVILDAQNVVRPCLWLGIHPQMELRSNLALSCRQMYVSRRCRG